METISTTHNFTILRNPIVSSIHKQLAVSYIVAAKFYKEKMILPQIKII